MSRTRPGSWACVCAYPKEKRWFLFVQRNEALLDKATEWTTECSMVHSYILTRSVIKGTKDVEQLENSGPLRASTCKLFRSFCKTRQITMAQWQLLLFNETEISGPVFCNLTKDLVPK